MTVSCTESDRTVKVHSQISVYELAKLPGASQATENLESDGEQRLPTSDSEPAAEVCAAGQV